MIDESNVELAWRSEDEQYGRLFREIKTERRGAKMGQWLSNLAQWEVYLIAAPSIMLGAILLLGGIILLLESPKRGRG
jgi:hypothetical protein